MNQPAEKITTIIEGQELILLDSAITEYKIPDITLKALAIFREAEAIECVDTESRKVLGRHRANIKSLHPKIDRKRIDKNKEFTDKNNAAATLIGAALDSSFGVLDGKIKEYDSIAAENRLAKAKIESARLAEIELIFSDLSSRAQAGQAYDTTSGEIEKAIEDLCAFEISSVDFQEQTKSAESLKASSLETLSSILAGRIRWEEAQIESAKVKAEQEAEAKRLADERAVFEAKQKTVQEEKDRVSTIEIEIKQLEKLCFFMPGISVGVLKAHKENMVNMKPTKEIFQERYSDACSIVETAFGKVFIAWEAAIKEVEAKEKTRHDAEKLEADRKALEKEKAQILADKQAGADRKFSELWDEAHELNFTKKIAWASDMSDYYDDFLKEKYSEDWISALKENAIFNTAWTRAKEITENIRKEKLKTDKARTKLINLDKKKIQATVNQIDKMISEVIVPECETMEAGKIICELYVQLKEALSLAEIAGVELV